MPTISLDTEQHILECKAAALFQTVHDDQLSALIEFNDHEKTHMHYHLRQNADKWHMRIHWLSVEFDFVLFFPSGHKVVVVRCEGINISGNFYRNKRE